MNWFSHWDEDLENMEGLVANLTPVNYNHPTEKEINELFGHDNAVECIYKVEAPKTDNLISCPYCGESYYMENYSECTDMYFPPIYKNGVNINPDKNIITTHCVCQNCAKDFSYKMYAYEKKIKL